MKTRIKIAAFVLCFIIILLVGFGCLRSNSPTFDNTAEIDKESILSEARKGGLIMDESEIDQMISSPVIVANNGKTFEDLSLYKGLVFNGWLAAALADVNGGGSFGLAHAQTKDGVYTFVAEMGGLPILTDDTYYEGWIVRRGQNFSLISTGEALLVEDRVYNIFVADEDLTDYDFYVLTLENRDANTAPSKHILEGSLK